jgi:hypothetical protein
VTAAITGTTAVTGRADGIGGVRAGDEVSAQLTGTAGRLTATAIQDLASALPGQLVRGVASGRGAGVAGTPRWAGTPESAGTLGCGRAYSE